MRNRRNVALILVLSLILLVFCPQSFAAHVEPEISAQSAVVLECGTNTVLYERSPHVKLPMASTTKVMTALLAVERGNLDEIITIVDEAFGVEGSSIYLQMNEKISMRDLVYGLMLRSGNDAAVAIAHRIGGSEEGFCEMMNARAKELGAFNTNFCNPNGLPDENHYTTAYDLALICSEAMKNLTFREIASTQYYVAESGAVKRTMMNKNKLLWQYDGAIGIKTGYTKAAGKCLTFAAERNGMTVVGVELNCPNMFPDAEKLMEYCYNSYEMYTIIKAGMTVVRMSVDNSDGKLLTLETSEAIIIPVKKNVGIQLKTQIALNDSISAPICAGDEQGKLLLYNGETPIGQCGLCAADDVNPPTIQFYLMRLFGLWNR